MKDPLDDRTIDIDEPLKNNKVQIVGYVRVSSIDQNTDRQLDGLKLDKIFIDKMSGKTKDRPELNRLLEYVRQGDTVVVHSLDRLARNLEDLISIINTLNKKGVIFQSLKENLKIGATKNPMDTLILHIFGAVAEFNRALIRETQREGIAKAKLKGKYKGRKSVLTPEVKSKIDELVDKKNSSIDSYKQMSYKDIAKNVGISLPTLNRYLYEKKKKNN